MEQKPTITTEDLEIDITNESVKAIIKGKTGVPFKTLVKLILQRKVTALFEKWGNDAIVINSELLTDLASAPQDNEDNRMHMIYVTFAVGMFAGIFTFVLLQLILLVANIQLFMENLLFILLTMLGVMLIGWVTIKARRRPKGTKLYDAMESIASVVPKKWSRAPEFQWSSFVESLQNNWHMLKIIYNSRRMSFFHISKNI